MALIIWANNVLQIIKINNLNINNLKNWNIYKYLEDLIVILWLV